ncbi:unnamed protein product [Ranitomeya imitator]|uniref:GIY-YIG domain-containing protein n=1 Tax=Ranitomeya imitator TaxID=111125 RepID=A0ABN9M4J4_9NEOB|nr:unnamed protein product [Ranitomeya imitator]
MVQTRYHRWYPQYRAQGSEASLITFMMSLNDNPYNIKLMYKYSKKEVEFLDVLIQTDSNGFLTTDVYRKSTAVNALLHASSAHHPQTTRAIPVGQFLRMRHEDLSRYLPANPSVTWRRSKNLKDLLTRSHYVAPQKSYFSTRAGPVWGSFQCGDCSACQYMDRAFTFDNNGMTRAYKITHHISCTTDMVIYYAYCPCKLIYVGMTRQLRVRILEHAREIKNAAMAHDLSILKTIPKHFRTHHNSNPKTLRVKGIDRVQLGIRGGDYRKELLKRETKWLVA